MSNGTITNVKKNTFLPNTTCTAVAFGSLLLAVPGFCQYSDPSTSMTFGQATQGLPIIQNYAFGTGPGRTIGNVQQLSGSFNPYGIAGTTVINQEWERYQPFNTTNFVFTNNTLDLTATIPAGGGLYSGGINSGQIWTKQTFKPGYTGYTVFGFEIRMKIPGGPGMWPASWFYTQSGMPGMNDGSEIDNPEFFDMATQNEFDWTGYQHGPGQGAQLYSIKTNQWVWQPGLNFSADYHDYQTFWTPDAVYKYVDGTLIYAQAFKWTAAGAAQFGANLAVGTPIMPGLQPTSLSQFPSALSVDHITIWAK